MYKKITTLILLAALLSPGVGGWADDVNATGNNNNPVTHPVNAYTNHEVKADMKSGSENSAKAKAARTEYKEAKAAYEKSLKDNGADNDVTVAAKKRMTDARTEMHKYYKKTAKANSDLKKDENQAQQ